MLQACLTPDLILNHSEVPIGVTSAHSLSLYALYQVYKFFGDTIFQSVKCVHCQMLSQSQRSRGISQNSIIGISLIPFQFPQQVMSPFFGNITIRPFGIFNPYICQKLVNLFYRCFEVNSYSSFVMLSYAGAFPFFSSLIADRISFKVGFSVFIAPSESISADAGGSGPLRTSLKFHSSVILLHFLLSEVTHFSPLYV